MILCVDIGNTNINCGLFDNNELVKKFQMPSNNNLTAIEFAQLITKEVNAKFEGAIISSVVDNLSKKLYSAIYTNYKIKALLLTNKLPMPITFSVDNPDSVGADRVANCVRAYNKYPNSTVIIIDYGTATTFDILKNNGEFIGGLIAPGIRTQINSLALATDKLSQIEIENISSPIGKNTKDNILSGIILGTASMADGMIEKSQQELGEKAIIVTTGGFCNIISQHMTIKPNLITQDFTLEGLRDLYNFNIQKRSRY